MLLSLKPQYLTIISKAKLPIPSKIVIGALTIIPQIENEKCPASGIRTRVGWVRASYPNRLD